MYKPERNFNGIQFEELRKKIDKKYNDVHDELSDCYYQGLPFRNYGILDKETFDKLHGLIFLHRDIGFHEENLKQSKKKRIPEEKYNKINKGIIKIIDSSGQNIGASSSDIINKSDLATEKIQELKNEGIELEI